MITGPDGFPKNYAWFQTVLASLFFYILLQVMIAKGDGFLILLPLAIVIILSLVLIRRAIDINAKWRWSILALPAADLFFLYLAVTFSSAFFLLKIILFAMLAYKLMDIFFLSDLEEKK